MKKTLVAIGIGILLISCNKTKNYTYPELVNRLTNLEALAILPEAGETAKMWSSYCQDSKYNEKTGKYENWDYNFDGFKGVPQFIRKEVYNGDSVQVLAEMTGPGFINRIWSATPDSGHVMIFIDGNETPVVDIAFIDFFSGKVPPFNYSELVYHAAQGKNNFVPISYQKSCKIVAAEGYGEFYQFNYTSLPEGSTVPSFTMNLNQEDLAALAAINEALKVEKQNEIPKNDETSTIISGTPKLEKGKTLVLADLKEEGAIRFLRIKLPVEDSLEQREVYRKIAIQISWDGETSPSVWAPIGDFFGTTPGYNQYQTLAMGMDQDGYMFSNWYMPYKSAQIELINESDKDYDLSYEIFTEKLEKPIKDYGRFHAKWHRDITVGGRDTGNSERWPDWEVVLTQGKGRFVGMMLNVWNPRASSSLLYAWPGPWWWGEGDEKFHVDGEKQPSFYGTGTEDYFGYAWCDPTYFQKAFHSQSFTRNNQHQTICRWHITDNIPFQTSFDGYLEKFFPNFWPTQYAVMAYWYLSADGVDKYKPLDVSERYGYQTPFTYSNDYKAKGAIEAERMKLLKTSQGGLAKLTGSDLMRFDKLSNDTLLYLQVASNDDTCSLFLEFESKKAGEFTMKAAVIKWILGGQAQIYLNDDKVGDVIDYYALKNTSPIDLITYGKVKLKKGTNTLRFEVVGEHPDRHQTMNRSLNIDYFLFE